MKISRRLRFLLTASITGLSIAAAPAQVPTFSLKAVKRNPTCTAGRVGEVCGGDRQCDSGPLAFDGQCGGDITPTSTVSAEPGDIIVTEIFGSNWSPDGQRLWGFQFTEDDRGYANGGGTIVPLGWNPPPREVQCAGDRDCPLGMWCDTEDGECKPKSCTSDADCPPEFPVCRARCCAGLNDNPDDTDGDGICDSADVCPGFDDNADADGDGIPDGCDMCPGYNDAEPCPIPAVSEWGMIAMTLLVLAAGTLVLRGRRQTSRAVA